MRLTVLHVEARLIRHISMPTVSYRRPARSRADANGQTTGFRRKVGAIVATHFLPEFAFAETLPAANLVPPPRGGLHANYNYYLYAGGNPITDLSVEVHLTEDLVAEAGFSIQLNGWSPTNARSVWQQYCYGFYTENIAKPQISWSIENLPTSEYREYLHRTIGLRIPSDLFNLHGQRVMVPGPGVKVPKGYKFRIALVHDPKGR